jgi:hypothetical protein
MNPNSGFIGYDSGALEYSRTPSGSFTLNTIVSTSQLISVSGTSQSLISGTPVTFSIDPSLLTAYVGISTIKFDVYAETCEITIQTGSYFVNSANLRSPTTITLQYVST